MIKSVSSPRKIATKGVASPRTPRGGGTANNSPLVTPRTPRKLNVSTKPSAPRKLTKDTTNKVEVMELPKKLVAGSNSINLKGASSGDRVRNGGAGDSCMRLPLECMSKTEIKDKMKESILPYHYMGLDSDENSPNEEEDEQEEFDAETMTTILAADRARFNIWKGVNYDLHLLGDFKSDFERRVKSFQRPETISISMNPFCRSESGLVDEPSRGDAFQLWKSRKSDSWLEHSNQSSEHDITIATFISSEEEDDADHIDDDSDTDSLPDPEIMEYIRSQKEKAKEGLNLTGETLYYDEEFDVVRNLHRDSHSLTNYGMMPDDRWIGKAHIFYPEMSLAEKNMLKAVATKAEVNTDHKKTSPPTMTI